MCHIMIKLLILLDLLTISSSFILLSESHSKISQRNGTGRLKNKQYRKWEKHHKKLLNVKDNEIELVRADMNDSELVNSINADLDFKDRPGLRIFQGDILIDESTTRHKDGLDKSSRHKVKRGAVKPNSLLWPGGVIYYEMEKDLGEVKKQIVKSAMAHWQKNTCIQFVERMSNQSKDFLKIINSKGCYSWVGRQGGEQEISVGKGCVTMGIVAHELAHAIGFYHEQSRPDRDNYVRLVESNIKEGQKDNFKKREVGEVDSLNVEYDYGSIMHYGLNDFSNNHQPTLETLKEVPSGTVIGQRSHLSKQDIRQANLLYKCPVIEQNQDTLERSSRQMSDSIEEESLMIVGGTQDTTEPLCLDGITFKGNQVLVTHCSSSKSAMKWSWTPHYQLQNKGTTLCLAASNGTGTDIPLTMLSCDSRDDRQKWMCNGGFLINVALDMCINAAWQSYRDFYKVALSKCITTDITQVMSVYGMGKKYQPVCRKWSEGIKAECNQQPIKKSYLGCSGINEAMIGYDRSNKRNNLKGIKNVECCQLLNTTGKVFSTTIRTMQRSGQTDCPVGFFVKGIRLFQKENSLKALSMLVCSKPSDGLAYRDCYNDVFREDNTRGMNVCSRGGYFMAGIYKKRCTRLSCIKMVKCCSIDINYTR